MLGYDNFSADIKQMLGKKIWIGWKIIWKFLCPVLLLVRTLMHVALQLKPLSHLAEYFFRLFTIEINSAILNNLKPIGMMKMHCVTIYLNIYECVSDNMVIHNDRF